MIRIGDFARIAGVSVATLRHYDEEGLLTPCHVHQDSGYRFYRPDQLRDIHRIKVLKDLGFSLQEVRTFLQDPPDPAEMRRLLAAKRAEAEQRLEMELAQIQRIEHRISIIEKDQKMPQLEVVRKTVPAVTIAAIRLSIPTNNQVGKLLSNAYERLDQALLTNRISKRGPSLAIWYSSPGDLTDEVVDAAWPIDADTQLITATHENGPTSVGFSTRNTGLLTHSPEVCDAVIVRSLPETEVASAVHTGPFSEFVQCHVVLSEWLSANGYHLEGAYREIYHACSENDATTEVQYPILKD